jgi:hypothetical protein
MEFEIRDSGAMWGVLSKACNDALQPINELIDNAIAAIQAGSSKTKAGKIYVTLDIEAQRGSIEHSGGTTFPLDIPGIVRCFTYGGKDQSFLNEHGCGLKTSLAILDPSNSAWKIWIKSGSKFYSISAPYTDRMKIVSEDSWPGEDKTNEPGTFIQFPAAKGHFGSLFAKKTAKMKAQDVDQRLRNHLAHMWMYVPEIVSGNVEIKYKGERVLPFHFGAQCVSEFVETHNPRYHATKLSTGGKVEVEEIDLRESYKKIPGTSTFKYAQTANGIYLYKNGRFIEFICRDTADTDVYSRVFGGEPHHSHNGTIKLINLVGPQDKLPPTIPTKNKFVQSELLCELFETLPELLRKPMRKHTPESEDSIVAKYVENTQKNMAAAGIVDFHIEREKEFVLPSGGKTPPVDVVEIRKDSLRILEFKKNAKPTVQDYSQIFWNWVLVCASNDADGKIVKPALYLQYSDGYIMPKDHIEYLEILKEKQGFSLEIYNTRNDKLYPVAKA